MKSMVSMVAVVASGSLLVGACAPSAKPVAYVGGVALSVAGTVIMADAASTDCTPEDPFTGVFTVPACASASALGTMFGAATLLTGAAILVAAMVSPSASDSLEPPPEALPASPGLPGASPASLPPSRSPSAPSGSPLAQSQPLAQPLAQPQPASLSMRAGSQLALY